MNQQEINSVSQPKQKKNNNKQNVNQQQQPQQMQQNNVQEHRVTTNAYPYKFETSGTLPVVRATHAQHLTKNGEMREGIVASIAGRVVSKRSAGKTLHFIDVAGDGDTIQVIIKVSVWCGNNDNSAPEQDVDPDVKLRNLVSEISNIQRGDIYGFEGIPGLSDRGEFSIFATKFILLAPCLYPSIPKNGELKDMETRYNQRYLDLMINRDNIKTFQSRSNIIKYIRRFFDDRDFIEVETPILNAIASGAAAKPFKTHHNDLNREMVLRISPELYLKMLVIGGMDRVYEIGRQFRNESIDLTHNPEFTSIEMYWAYKDYNDLITMTEELLRGMAISIHGGPVVKFSPKEPSEKFPETEIDYGKPFNKLRIIPELEKYMNIKFPENFDSQEFSEWLLEQCQTHNVEVLPPYTTPRLFDALISHYLEPLCDQPTFLIDHPHIMSPLAKKHRDDPRLSERFELFIMKKEIANAYTEQNNPKEQRNEFIKQAGDKSKGDEEAMSIDEGFITSLEYGMPPTAGWGLGVDRLVMFMTSHTNIKEVILFPAMRVTTASAGATAN